MYTTSQGKRIQPKQDPPIPSSEIFFQITGAAIRPQTRETGQCAAAFSVLAYLRLGRPSRS